jgi:tetratricopeptide (TPR) repeat protein
MFSLTLNEAHSMKSSLLIAFLLLFSFTLVFGLNQFSVTSAETNVAANTNALINKGQLLDKLGNYTQAIQYYDQALSIEPK